MGITKTTSQSWFGRIGGSIKGILVGGIMFFVAFPVLFLNEGRAVRTAKGLAEGAGAVVRVDASQIESQNEGAFVHVSGQTATDEVLRDPDFGVELTGVRLTRHVEMYQWTETTSTKTKKKLGGGTETVTVFDYEKTWKDSLINTSDFEQPEGHQNPSAMVFSRHEEEAKNVQLGAFKLPPTLVSKISTSEPVDVDKTKLPEEIRFRTKVVGDGGNGSKRLYIKAKSDPVSVDINSDSSEIDDSLVVGDSPEIGDLRVWFTNTPVSEVSVMSKQVGNGFEPFKTLAGTNLHMLTEGVVSAEAMIEKAEADNVALTWLLRILGAGMMCLGIALVLRPLAVIGDVVPFVGSIIGTGTTLVAGLIGAGVAFCTISLAWLVYRPLIGIPLLVLGLGLIFVIVRMVMKQRAKNDSSEEALPVELVS